MNKKTSRTGIEEMFGKVFADVGITETVDRMDRIQTTTPTSSVPLLTVVSPPAPPSTEKSDGCSDSQSDGQTDEQPLGQSFRRSLRQSDGQTVAQTVNQTVYQTVNYPDADILLFSDPIKGLTRNQCIVLLYLIQQPGIAQRPAITERTGVPFGTVKDALAAVVKKGFISKPKYFVNGDYRGFSYVINKGLCDDFLKKRGHEFNRTVTQTVIQTVAHTDHQTDGQKAVFSSSLLKESKPTTKTGILDDPELRFWVGEGVTEKQVSTWALEFDMSTDEITMSLRYGRFDILERGDIQNSANWFYKILKRNCCYPRPANYRSPLEVRAEQMQEQLRRNEEAKKKIAAMEFEIKFQDFMSKPDDPVYQELFNELSEFAKGDTKALEIELREVCKSRWSFVAELKEFIDK